LVKVPVLLESIFVTFMPFSFQSHTRAPLFFLCGLIMPIADAGSTATVALNSTK